MFNVPATRLYEPLTSTLDKSMVRNPALQLTKSRAYEQIGATSRISRRMRSLSPQQATYIKSSTFLPIDKDLVPTDNLWRVRGKQFSAVNIEVKQGAPIPASMIRFPQGVRGGVITTETVYEARPKSSVRVLNNTRSITNLRTVYPPPVAPVHTVTRNQIPPVTSRIIQPVQQSVQVRRPASPVRVSSRQSIPIAPMVQSIQSSQYQPRTIQPLSRTNVNDQFYNQQVTTKNIDMGEHTNQRPSTPANQYYGADLRSQYDDSSKKGKYKYNFFSALDEAVNTKCGSCGANQIIATKPLSSWE